MTAPASRDPLDLTGVWDGLFTYPGFFDPGVFVATLLDLGTCLSGSTHEPSFTDPRCLLFAEVSGRRTDRKVVFTKTYDGASGWDHSVLYSGKASEDGTEVEGTWNIPGEWSGRFLMVRSGAAAALRTARAARFKREVQRASR